MARGVRGKVRVIIELEEFDDTGVGSGAVVRRMKHPIDYTWEIESGTTDGTQMDRVWSTTSPLTTTPTDLDLVSASSLASKLDASLNVGMTDVCLLAIENYAAAGSGDVQVGASAAPWTGMLVAGDVASVKPQGILVWVAPYGTATTATTADLLRVVASTGTVNSRVIVAGRTV